MRKVVPFAVLVGLLAVPAVRGFGPLDLLITGVPSPGDVVKVIDALTKKDSSTSVDIRFGETFSQGKLLIARTKLDVVIDRSSKNWRGQVLVNMVVPTEVSYSIDLTQIRPEHVRLDPEGKLLFVVMPPPTVEDVTPLLSAIKTENAFKHARFKFFDKNTSRELQNSMLQHDYQIRARRVALQNAEKVRPRGRAVLQAFLQHLLQRSIPGVEVLVD